MTLQENRTSSMSQMIFKLNLPVETVSVYLLCCGLKDNEKKLSLKNLLEIWNETPELLKEELYNLEKRKIIRKIISTNHEHRIYRLNDPKEWVNEL